MVAVWIKSGGDFRPQTERLHPSTHGACPVADLHPSISRLWLLATVSLHISSGMLEEEPLEKGLLQWTEARTMQTGW